MHLNEGQIDWREQSGGRLRSLPSGPERENMVEGTESHGRRSPLSINHMIGRVYAEPRPHLMEQSQRMGVRERGEGGWGGSESEGLCAD